MTSCTTGLATFTQVQPYRSILGTFRKVATPSSGTAYVGPYCMFPTPVEVRYFFGMLSAVTPSPYCQSNIQFSFSFYIYYNIFFLFCQFFFIRSELIFYYNMPRYPIRFKLSGAQRVACLQNQFFLSFYIYYNIFFNLVSRIIFFIRLYSFFKK